MDDRSQFARSTNPGTSDAYSTFLHLAAPKVEIYRLILRALGHAKEHFEIALRPAEILVWCVGTTNVSENEILQALEPLRTWGNLGASPDIAEVRTVEEFNRPRYLYHFTAAGEATEQALTAFDQHFMRPGELQATALREILQTLEELEYLLVSEPLDLAKSAKVIRDLADRFQQLVSRAQSFMRSIQSSLVGPTSELDVFLQHKEALLNYLERFIGELVLATYRVSSTLRRIESIGIERALQAAADAEIADALEPDARQREIAYEHWVLIWQGLRRWFLGQEGAPSQAEVLRVRARAAIPALLETVRRLNDQRASRSDRATDFIALARWFASAPTEDDLHRLWRAAFALTSARHFRANEETLSAWESFGTTPRTSWSDAPPFYLTPRLRETGRATSRGPVRAVVNRSADLARLAVLAEEEERKSRAARKTLATGRPRQLSDLPPLEEAELELLLDLLSQALAGEPDAAGTIQAISEDGTLFIQVTAPNSGVPEATVVTQAGTLRGPDYTLTISDGTHIYASRAKRGAS